MGVLSKIKAVGEKIAIKGNKVLDKCKKHSPEILVGVGITGFGFTVYESCKATIKVKDILDEHGKLMHGCDIAVNAEAVNKDGTIYSEEDCAEDKKHIKIQTGVKIAKACIKPFGGFLLSSTAVLYGLHIIKKRYLNLAIAYNGLKASYDLLYKNVEKEYGTDKAFELANGLEKVGETENGDPIYKKTEDSGTLAAPYVEFITPTTCKYWDNNSWFMDQQVQNAERNANELRGSRGYILWYDICKELGLRNIKPIAARVGWVFDQERIDRAKADGLNPDGFVDLRITKIYYNEEVDRIMAMDESVRESEFNKMDELFFNSGTGKYEQYIYMINPNVDGEIYQYM